MDDMTIIEYVTNYLNNYCLFEWGLHDTPHQTKIEIFVQAAHDAPLVTALIHDPVKSRLDEKRFSMALAFDSKTGIQEGLLELWLTFLKRYIQQMLSTYRLTGVWQWQVDDELFQTTVATYKQVARYKENRIAYKKD